MSIQVRDLTYIYDEGMPDETKALDGISFDVYNGEILGIIGHTGSGKSTLMQHLNGLLKPYEGYIVIDGKDITDPQTQMIDIRRKVGLVFQYPEYQLFEDTVEKDVAFGPRNIGLSEEEVSQRVKESLKLVDLDYEELKDRSPFDLSGGQKRRVAIAGVLAMDPHVLVLDEPMAGLDPESHMEIVSMIKNLHRDKNRIIIFVSHNMQDIANLCDRVVMMDRGIIVSCATPEEIFSNRVILNNAGLDVPPVTRILFELKARGIEIDTGAVNMEEALGSVLGAFKKAGLGDRGASKKNANAGRGASEKNANADRGASEESANAGRNGGDVI